tara:strand:+ start:275 stop:886 length:612 start_codon:yes stop_codon:yes gene_type:complete
VNELTYQAFVWLTYRLALTFGLGVPLILLIWSFVKKEASIIRLLSIYWKVSSLLGISILLLADKRSMGYLTLFLAPILTVIAIWFWIDINEELIDLPPNRALPLTVRIWRWSFTSYSALSTTIAFNSLSCISSIESTNCAVWTEFPQYFHDNSERLFKFLFGANWSEPVAAFIGYIALIAYIVGLLQWVMIKLPKQGRIAGEF